MGIEHLYFLLGYGQGRELFCFKAECFSDFLTPAFHDLHFGSKMAFSYHTMENLMRLWPFWRKRKFWPALKWCWFCWIFANTFISLLDICWIFVRYLLDVCWFYWIFANTFISLLDICQIFVGYLSDICWIFVDFVGYLQTLLSASALWRIHSVHLISPWEWETKCKIFPEETWKRVKNHFASAFTNPSS